MLCNKNWENWESRPDKSGKLYWGLVAGSRNNRTLKGYIKMKYLHLRDRATHLLARDDVSYILFSTRKFRLKCNDYNMLLNTWEDEALAFIVLGDRPGYTVGTRVAIRKADMIFDEDASLWQASEIREIQTPLAGLLHPVFSYTRVSDTPYSNNNNNDDDDDYDNYNNKNVNVY
ncbi:hypothetical protein QTP88_017057 [Uroleucon formosanum]